MISLIPAWAKQDEEFWNAIKKRNLWFIKLRYGAVALLSFFLVSLEFLLKLKLTPVQLSAIIIITVCILFYNIIIHWVRPNIKPEGKINNLHLSLLQMIFDLIALTLLIHYTGGIENPLFMFYIFHMIIGSLILPGVVIYTIAGAVVCAFSLVVFLEYYGVLSHYYIAGLFAAPIYNNENYLLIVLTIFIIMMFLSVTIANKIAQQLYQIESQLRESLEKLNEAEKAKQHYVIGIVHEIKTPIAAVGSFIELILKDFLGPISSEVKERLVRAKVRTDEAIKMINNVLHISKLKLLDEIFEEEINLTEIVERIIAKQKVFADTKNIELLFEKQSCINSKIYGDSVLIELAVSNIINNSVKYAGNNGKVEIILEPENENCTLEICDNGIGIPKEDQQKIFDEFYRASNIKHKGYEGTGLGLSLVKQIISRHKGEICVESPSRLGSENNPGTCFIIKMPVKKT